MTDKYLRGSFYDRHPVLAIVVIVAYLVFAGIPAVLMFSENAACAVGASDPWCPAEEPRP